ncbi:MAG: TonB-dependent receptor plug domain-containing protein, partial [Gammaproteobacteria bacterium]
MNKGIWPRHLAWLGVLVTISPSIVADQADRAEKQNVTEEIIVTADPLAQADPHIVRPVTVITRAALNRANTRNIGEAVANELGVTSGDFGGNVGRPIIRGLGGPRVRVLENGIGTMDVSTVSPDHAVAVEPAFARQVEIFRGPATLLYGSGASGGLVNVVDNRILDYVPDRLSGELGARYDTATEGRQGAFEIETGFFDVFALHLEGLDAATDDYSIPDFAEADPDPGERS